LSCLGRVYVQQAAYVIDSTPIFQLWSSKKFVLFNVLDILSWLYDRLCRYNTFEDVATKDTI